MPETDDSAPAARTGSAAAGRVYETLRTRIIEGEIPPQTRVNIDAIARESGVSQTPVREALQRLEGDGLVTSRAARGYSTTAVLDLAGLTSLFEFRLLIEPWTARAAAAERLTNPAAELERELAAFRRIVEAGRDIRQEMLVHDTRFHDAIVSSASNPVLYQAYTQTHPHLHTFRLYPVDLDGSETLAEHTLICQAIRDCRPDDAEALMASHIASSFARSAGAFPSTDDDSRPSLEAQPRRPTMVRRRAVQPASPSGG